MIIDSFSVLIFWRVNAGKHQTQLVRRLPPLTRPAFASATCAFPRFASLDALSLRGVTAAVA